MADADALRVELAAGTLAAAFTATAAAHPNRPALRIGDSALTHGELDELSARTAHGMAALGAGPDRRVILSGATSMWFVVAYLAVLRTGASVVLAGAQQTEPELEHLVVDSGASLVFADAAPLAHFKRIAQRHRDLTVLGSLTDGDTPHARPVRDLATDPRLEPVSVRGEATAVLAYTSGTTGRPKGVPLSHASLLASIRGVMMVWRWSEDDVLVHALPLTHQHGLGGVHATLLAGSRAVVMPRFEPDGLLEALREESATVLFAVPAMYERLAKASPPSLPALRLAVSGSAPLTPSLASRVQQLLGQAPLERYGTTESGLNVSNLYDGPRVAGAVGLPLPGVEVDVVNEDGVPLPAGADGEIVLRGPQVFTGYHADAEATRAAFFPDGWFRTGDIGRIAPDDEVLSITGRLKELIISGGLNVYPREVELALEDHPAIARVAVVGVPSPRWGEEVVAAVVPARAHDTLPVESLAEHASQRLARYKRPKRYVAVDTIPVNAMGKVLRGEVVARIGPAEPEDEVNLHP